MRKALCLLYAALLVACASGAIAADRDLMSDTWTATDALGRTLPGFAECGAPRDGKFVGIFYFTWLGQHSTTGPHDITKLLAANPDDPKWGPEHHFHHWGEPELGYYVSTDEYVIRYHARMLSNAGIDTIIFDVTNAVTYTNVYMKLCEIFTEIRRNGGRTPQIGFIAHSAEEKTVEKLYDEFYSKGLYSDLWFRWQGKPLIMANPENMPQHIKDFFTFRYSWAWSNPGGWFGDGRDKWPWLDAWPQNPGWHVEGVPEQVSVCAAQHPTTNIGRSHHDNKQPGPEGFRPTEGVYFQQQWDRALEVDPQFIFITGWNEWVAQRFISDGNGPNMLGKKLNKGESFFVDQYNQEYSRDIEPMRGGHTDNYYYQMIANIRRFKGVRAPEKPSVPRIVRIDGRFADWTLVKPEYRDWIGDIEHRDSQGWKETVRYTNYPGQNDIVRAKVTCNESYVYFYVETKDDITPKSEDNGMVLMIDTDCNQKTGWNGYEFEVRSGDLDEPASLANYSPPHMAHATSGNKMEIAVPRKALGFEGKPVKLDFHWVNFAMMTHDIIDFLTNGDHAPDRRFNYHFEER